jgi:threonine 3-dehydrogenase
VLQRTPRHRLSPTPIITHRFAINDFAKGFAAMRSGESGKVVLVWE